MQYKPSKWVSGYKHGPAASYTQITRMGLFLNVSTSKFEPLDSTWDNLHSGGMFISDDNKIYFRDETNKDIYINSNADNEITIAATSGVTISGGNLIIGTAGKGIDFSNQASPATGMTSELLDRYEEGTFTPTFTGVTSISYTTQLGFYSRVGDTVYVLFYFVGSWTASGQLVLNGLPFTVSLSSGAAINISFQNCEAVAPVGYGATGTTTATFYEQGTLGTTWNPPSVTGKYLVGSGVYKTAT